MERAKLIVKNFGPLEDIEIEVREMVTFIGAQASGKSTLAKLLSIFEDENFRRNNKITFEDELRKYNMFSFLREDSYIFYKRKKMGFVYSFVHKNSKSEKFDYGENLKSRFIKLSNERKTTRIEEDYFNSFHKILLTDQALYFENRDKAYEAFKKKTQMFLLSDTSVLSFDDFFDFYENLLAEFGIIVKFDSLYIPSERNFLHLIAENTLGLINNNIQIPKHILNIGQEYEKALNSIKELPLNLIDKTLIYKRDGKTSYIYHSENEKINLLESASGLQSIIPILLLVEYSKSLKEKYNFNFVVEEPELNLYPQAQHELVKYLVKNCLFRRKNLILTTHSPFILASINNLLLAFDKGKNNPKEVAKIIKKESWLNPNNFIAYELKNGKAKKIMNDKLGQIDENMIDKVSDVFSNEFDKLLDL
jgi:predicted ATPase